MSRSNLKNHIDNKLMLLRGEMRDLYDYEQNWRAGEDNDPAAVVPQQIATLKSTVEKLIDIVAELNRDVL